MLLLVNGRGTFSDVQKQHFSELRTTPHFSAGNVVHLTFAPSVANFGPLVAFLHRTFQIVQPQIRVDQKNIRRMNVESASLALFLFISHGKL